MKIKKRIFKKVNYKEPILITKEILDIIKVDDIINADYVDPAVYNEPDPGYYVFEIYRMVEETDEEIKKREEKNRLREENSKSMRYQSYLRLKKEFDAE